MASCPWPAEPSGSAPCFQGPAGFLDQGYRVFSQSPDAGRPLFSSGFPSHPGEFLNLSASVFTICVTGRKVNGDSPPLGTGAQQVLRNYQHTLTR